LTTQIFYNTLEGKFWALDLHSSQCFERDDARVYFELWQINIIARFEFVKG